MGRFLLSALVGIAVTFTLFVFMAKLIENDGQRKVGEVETIEIEIAGKPPESKAKAIKTPPPPPPPPKTPPKAPPPEPETSDPNPTGLGIRMPSINVGGNAGGMSGVGGAMNQDGDATPIVRIEPRFPVKAAREGKEGWVKLSFTINEVGGVEDVKVIEAQPKRLFNREAIRALRKWKYKPKVVEGKPQKQPGMKVQLDFSLNKDKKKG
ncbi:energy transducer TonB [Algicola sagamiensis]|uniref:energy transducer TonB n=1 Tax=Algicola sagamiensis TaxID=163869 RepID=UPI00036D092E|nr:energy transducer TonB [Algicola sagamiensis]